MSIKFLPFPKVIEDVTSKFTKIKKQNYLKNGKYPIVDQSKNLITGYTNDYNLVENFDDDIIIFGDHTRIFKYIDFPLAIGADGVKVLKVDKKLFNTKYLYYYFKFIKLKDAGYSRHFKFLKEKKIPLLEIDKQIRISNFLSQIEKLIQKREKSLELLDELIRSTFLNMFESPISNPKKWKKTTLGELGDWKSGGTPSRVNPEFYKGDISWISSGELNEMFISSSNEHITEEALVKSNTKLVEEGSLLLGMYDTSALKSSINTIKLACNQAIAFSKLDEEKCNTYFIYHLIQIGKKYFKRFQRGARQKNMNISMVKNIPIMLPPKELQDKFAEVVIKIEKTKKIYQSSLNELNYFFGAVSQKAFKGELDLSKIKLNPEIKDQEVVQKTKQEITLQQPKKEKKSLLNNLLNIGLIVGGSALTVYTAKKIFDNYNKDVADNIVKSGKDIIDFTNNIIEYDKDVQLQFNDRFLKSFIKAFQETEVVSNNRLLEELYKVEFQEKLTFSDIKDALVNLLEKKEVEQFKHKYETTKGFEENVAFRIKE